MAMRHRKREVEAPAPTGPARVLVVHDDPDGCELLVRILSRAGYPVDRAHDYEQMVGRLADEPRCVVLDVSAGGIGANLKLLDAVRNSTNSAVSGSRVVLIVTATSNTMFSWQAGIDGLLHRPFHADDLVLAVAEVLGRPEEERAPHRRRMVEAARIGERGEPAG
ncbi:MAG TPA: response regulator [Acidimicrobiales bacterium]|nr:response regulator [Acidimicrobiales bacterium]